MELFPAVYILASVAALAIATYTDLKARIVPNRLTFGIAGLALLLKGTESYIAATPQPLIEAVTGGIIAFIACYILYRAGVWAGGDVKLVSSLALLNPVNYAFIAKSAGIAGGIIAPIQIPIFSVSLIVYSAFAVLPLGVAMSVAAAMKHREAVSKTIGAVKSKLASTARLAALAAGAHIILSAAGQEQLIVIPLILLVTFLPEKIRTMISIIATATGIIISAGNFVSESLAVGIPVIVIYGAWKLYCESRDYAFKESISTKALEEGMIPDCIVVEREGKIEFAQQPPMRTVINQLIANKIQRVPEGDFTEKVISGPRNAAGLSVEEAEKIAGYAKKGLCPQEIVIKKTMAFVPAILIAYVALQLAGDILWNLLLT
ncbi:MAG TPA: prepilin peptidase [Candidatus Diapherotrites archaeon]|uniref:Prepilin peptidase n=1 Tax=Candidatus Iainarchaeum sp. TaxID=3101447 RepID=A0A7J4J4V3_9ARCH|nr:prepilin peptidase [Candidatus Diapherotrites archaeon]